MTLFSDNVDLLADTMSPPRYRGVTGRLDTNGQVNPNPSVDLPVGRVWVRMSNERTAIAVINTRVTTQRANIPVIMQENDNGNLEIIGLDSEDALGTYGAFASSLGMPDKPPEQEKSSVSHRRIQELRLRLSTTGLLTLHLNPGYYQKLNGDIVAFAGADIDLTALVPAVEDTKRLVLVGITTTTNTITSSGVTAVDTGTAPTSTPFFTLDDAATARNAAASGVTWLWAVPMFYAQTEFGNVDSFIDLRPIVLEEGITPVSQGGTGASTATAAFNALSPLTVKGDVIAYNGTDAVRLAVGASNGMQLIVDSTAATGLAWTAIGNTFEATLSTSDATVTPLISYTVAELVGVTLQGRIIAVKTDRTAAYGASFRVTFRRETAGSATLVGVGYVESDEDSGGLPTITFAADAGTQTGRVLWTGIAAENWSVKCHYTIVTL